MTEFSAVPAYTPYLLMNSGTRALHSYWDSQAVQYAMRRLSAASPADFADKLLAREQSAPAPDAGAPAEWPQHWATETLQVSQAAHQGIEPGEREELQDRTGGPHFAWPVTVPRTYARTASTLATQQLTRAGYRLAALLEAIWP